MIAFLRWIIGITGGIVVLYAIALNPQIISLHWNPAADPIDVPLYTIIIGTFLFGYLIGTLYLWISQLPKRLIDGKKRKEQNKRIQQLEKDLENQNDATQNLLRD